MSNGASEVSIKEQFEGFGEKARAACRGVAVFFGIALATAIVGTHAMLATSNGFASTWVIILMIAAIHYAILRGKRSYERALEEGDDE